MSLLDEMTGSRASEFRAARPTRPFLAHTDVGPSLFSAAAIDDFIASGMMRHPMMTMAKQGYRLRPHVYSWNGEYIIPGHESRIRPRRVAQQFASGATIIVESLHLIDQRIARVTDELTRETGTYVNACAFLAPAARQGFDHHYDTHDAFVVQVEGSKRWELFEPPFPQPLVEHHFEHVEAYPGLSERIARTPDMEFTMLPGDVLFLPRGWIHNPYSTDEQSLHLNFAMTGRSVHWVLTKALEDLINTEWARQEAQAPEIGGEYSRAELRRIGARFAGWINDNVDSLAANVGLAFADGVPERSDRPIARANTLPIRLEDAIVINPAAIRAFRPGTQGTELILMDGERVVIPAGPDKLVADAADSGAPVTVDTLASTCGEERAEALCADLVLLGAADVMR